MSAQLPEAVEQVLALSRQMLAAAQVGDWDAMAALQATRQPLLERHCTRDRVDAAVLDELRDGNAMLVACVERARARVASEWADARAGHRGTRDYQRIARDGGAQPTAPTEPQGSRP